MSVFLIIFLFFRYISIISEFSARRPPPSSLSRDVLIGVYEPLFSWWLFKDQFVYDYIFHFYDFILIRVPYAVVDNFYDIIIINFCPRRPLLHRSRCLHNNKIFIHLYESLSGDRFNLLGTKHNNSRMTRL